MKRALILSLALSAFSITARAQVSVIGSGVEEHAARPGETYSGTLRLRNDGRQAEEAKVYLTDYTFAADGTTRYAAAGSLPRSSARWIAFTPSQVRIPAGGEATVGYTVTVPADASLGGTYWSILMIEGIARGSAESTSGAANARVRVGIQPSTRYGVQIATTLEGTGAPKVSFTSARAYAAAQGKVLELDLANAGDVAYRPEIRVELFDAAGGKAGTFTSRRGLLYPGTSLRQTFELGAVPPGSYQALVVADAGGDQVFGAQYSLKL
ncbi:hypothetical protein [Longimicrobium sp.]|uniref:hypothetical protein n=1 Tax=Longimicrobium sp. TaxID=2029185 RepID=UPI002C395AA5|nr:hypothetical protein [Longimicrobium sp.]HSU15180.1 hypothetical protein [Longimicrobium sp.]